MTSVFDTSHFGSQFYTDIGSSSTFPGEQKDQGRETGQGDREEGVIVSSGWAAMVASDEGEREGDDAPQTKSRTEGGGRGWGREVFRDTIYVPVV